LVRLKAGHHEKKDAGHYEEIASNGNVNRKVAPPFTLLTPHNLPVTIDRLIARPIPIPAGFVV
jgi:hypothetical protein